MVFSNGRHVIMKKLSAIFASLLCSVAVAQSFVGQHGGAYIRGPTLADQNFTVAAQENDILISPGSSTQTTLHDIVENVFTSQSYDRNYQVIVSSFTPLTINQQITYSPINSSVASVDANGAVTAAGGGGTTLIKVSGSLISKGVSVNTVPVIGGSIATFGSYVSGSLAAVTTSAVDSIISGQTPIGNNTHLFMSAFSAHNPLALFASYDWTGVTSSDSNGLGLYHQGFNCTPISPSFVVSNHHIGFANGNTLTWISSSGFVVSRTATWVQIGTWDIELGKLNAPLPNTIKYYKLLPSNNSTYLPFISAGGLGGTNILYRRPMIWIDQSRHICIADHLSLNSGISGGIVPTDATRLLFFKSPIEGDSGGPMFEPLNGELVLLSTMTGNLGGPDLSSAASAINAEMATLGSSDTVTTADMAAYTSY